MLNKKLIINLFFLVISFIIFNSEVYALQDKLWPPKISNDIKKTWTISFNLPLDAKIINNNCVFIIDSNKHKISQKITMSDDQQSISLTPISQYVKGKSYELIITKGLFSKNNIPLTQNIVMPFKIITRSDNYKSVTSNKVNINNSQKEIDAIQDVKINSSSYITIVKVKVDTNVLRVSCNGKAMHYLGDNFYEIDLADMKLGSYLNIYAYDAYGKIITKEKWTIQ